MTIYGWDMSHFDAPSIGDAVAEGFSFFTHKAGGDSNSGDPELAAWWSGVKSTDPAKVLLGTYWVPRPDLYPDPIKEAARWIDTVDARCPGWRGRPHMLQMDAERWPAGDKTRPGRAYLQALGGRLVALMPKLRPICYASAGQYGSALTGLSFPRWNARYPSSMTGAASAIYQHVGGDSGPGWDSYSGQVPAIWQFTSSATIAAQSTCDANAYRGSLADLVALVAPGWENTMAITPADVNTIFGTDGVIGAPPPATPDAFWTAAQFFRNTYNESKAAHAAAAQAVAAVAALAVPAPAPVDVDALAAEVAAKAGPLIVQLVLDGLAARMQS